MEGHVYRLQKHLKLEQQHHLQQQALLQAQQLVLKWHLKN